MASVRGALSPDDPRSRATVRAVSDQLTEDGYAYRYAAEGRPLGEAEGAFLLCGLAMSLAHLVAGDTVEDYRWFERQRRPAGRRGCCPRSSTYASGSCAVTSRKASSTPCWWRAASGWATPAKVLAHRDGRCGEVDDDA
jgi:hypothetical protein